MDIVIVGGGIVGTAIAARLGDTDHDVTLLERSGIGGETTAASAGILMQTAVDPSPFDVRFRKRAASVYRRLFDDAPLESERVGTLYVAETEAFADRLEESAATLRARGIEASYVPADAFANLGVDPDGFVGGLHTPNDEICDPPAVAEWFATCARRNGVDVRTDAAVTDVVTRDRGGSRAVASVETAGDRLAADYVINVTGPWAPELNASVGVSLPLCHTLGPMAALEAPESIDGPVTILESKRYVRPTVGPAGGEGVVAWVGEYRTEYVEGERYDPTDRSVSAEFREAASDVSHIVPALQGARVVDDWLGLRTVTPDGRPIVGETSVDGFVVACGMTGQGVTVAPAVADVVRGVIDGSLEEEYRKRLGPDRF